MSALGSSVDPLLRTAIRRDGIGNGRIKTELNNGELVFVPWTMGQEGAGLVPTSNPFAAQNADKSGQYIFLESVAAGFGTSASVSGFFRGRSFGVRFEPTQTSGIATPTHSDFGVMIDRVAYLIPKTAFNPATQARQTDMSGSYGVVVTRDLCDGLHHFEIETRIFATKSTAVYCFGMLLEKAAGYREPQNYAMRSNPATLSTSATTFFSGFTSAFRTPRGISEVTYYNTTGAPINVTWRLNSVDYFVFTLAAGESRQFLFNPPIAGNHFSVSASHYMHLASATGVTFTAVGV